MKTLILTCNTGQGHNSSAAAIKEVFELNGEQCDIADAMSFFSKQASNIICKAFTDIYRHIPKVFDKAYANTDIKIGKSSASAYIARIVSLGSGRLGEFVKENGYSHIICVHIFASLLVAKMQRKHGVYCKNSFLPTDYTAYPMVEQTTADLYFLPHANLADVLVQKGLQRNKMIATGIPVRRAFLSKNDKEHSRNILNLPLDSNVIFIMCGSMGCGPMCDIAKNIIEKAPENTRLLISCGTNKKILNEMHKINSDKITAFSYSDNIPQIMSAADLFITKPGGISITEAGLMSVPMLLVDIVGGCETPNYRFFTEHNFALGADSLDEVADKCVYLLNNPNLLSQYSKTLYNEFYKDSAQQIYEAVMRLHN